MADIRFKDLTTTASTTAADDFFAADGTTNGTRKLSAYSPTFGGNATVGGTLTVNGTSTSAVAGLLSVVRTGGDTQASFGDGSRDTNIQMKSTGNVTSNVLAFDSGARLTIGATTPLGAYLTLYNGVGINTTTPSVALDVVGAAKISSTTASTTTSSGALVVGNGTSGGLGVGGSINAGGEITVAGNLTITGNNSALTTYGYNAGKGLSLGLFARGQSGGWTTGLHFYSSNTDNSASWYFNPTNGDLTLYSSSSSSNYASTDRALLINTSKQVQVLATTASTSTSSGALVVSGGVGVVGAINAGEAITTTQFGYAGGLSSNSLNFTRNSFNYVNLSGGSSASLNFNATTTTANDTSVFSYNNTRVAILTGTASNNTSSGALQVTGGVGVSGAIYANAVNALTSVKVANTSQSVPAYGDVGPQLSVAGAVITDTSSSGTVSRAVVNSIAASALAASSTTTYTQAASLFVAGAPTANTNVTITHGYALYTAGGRINFQGLPTSSAGLQAGTLWNDGGTLKIA